MYLSSVSAGPTPIANTVSCATIDPSMCLTYAVFKNDPLPVPILAVIIHVIVCPGARAKTLLVTTPAV